MTYREKENQAWTQALARLPEAGNTPSYGRGDGMSIDTRMAKLREARALKHANLPPNNKAVRAPAYATRYYHTLSTGKAFHVRVWQERKDSPFKAIVQGESEVFTGPTHHAAFQALVEHYEGIE